VQFYLTLLDTYLPDAEERARAFAAVETIPAIASKARFALRWTDAMAGMDRLASPDQRRQFLLNLIGFAAAIEGLFFFAAFAYVYFMRSRGLLNGLAAGTAWVFRDESAHIGFAFEVVETVRREQPELFDPGLERAVQQLLEEAVDCETAFAEDLLGGGVAGLSVADMRRYLEYVADQRLAALRLPPRWRTSNPFSFMELQDAQELTNFFERRVSAYQVGASGEVRLDEPF
jgi:ribonucleoside-diphosphate reductase beta chain